MLDVWVKRVRRDRQLWMVRVADLKIDESADVALQVETLAFEQLHQGGSREKLAYGCQVHRGVGSELSLLFQVGEAEGLGEERGVFPGCDCNGRAHDVCRLHPCSNAGCEVAAPVFERRVPCVDRKGQGSLRDEHAGQSQFEQ
jgi:hypothetical protein